MFLTVTFTPVPTSKHGFVVIADHCSFLVERVPLMQLLVGPARVLFHGACNVNIRCGNLFYVEKIRCS